MAVIVLSP